MSLHAQLLAIFKKYSFVHIDSLGQLSILVPLTGARTVNQNFNVNNDNPVSLYLFGDNTCKADLERTKFFKAGNNSFHQISNLIAELEVLHTEVTLNEQSILKTIISKILKQKDKAAKFISGNPGLNIMTDDLRHNSSLFTSKSDFVVAEDSDDARYFNLPNVLDLINVNDERRNSIAQLIPHAATNDYLKSLSQIKKANIDNDLLVAIRTVVTRADCRFLLSKTPIEIIKKIYQELQNTYSYLNDIEPSILESLVINLSFVIDPKEELNNWSNDEITDALLSVFRNARLIDETNLGTLTSFAKIYHHSLNQLQQDDFQLEQHESSEEHLSSYKLFILQSFLYLCAVQMRLRSSDDAKNFLNMLQDKDSARQIISNLCTDESGFRQFLENQFNSSPIEYQALIDSTHQIAVDHLDVPHFDELRTACMPSMLNNTHYLIIDGRLSWSTSRITEQGTINSIGQQQQLISDHFIQFMDLTTSIAQKEAIFELLQEALQGGKEYEEIAFDSLKANSSLFSEEQTQELLGDAIIGCKYFCAEYLMKNGVHSAEAFLKAFNQQPLNEQLIELFLTLNGDYINHIDASQLFNAVDMNQHEKAYFILKFRPDLIEQVNAQGHTYFLLACMNGETDVVEYLMNRGANTLVRDPVSGLTARELSQKTPNAYQLNKLFNTYPDKIKERLEINPNHSSHYLSNQHLIHCALAYGEHDLAEVILSTIPEMPTYLNKDDVFNAIDNNLYDILQLIVGYRPDLLEVTREEGTELFLHACKSGELSIIIYLVNVGADIYASGNDIISARTLVRELSKEKATLILEFFDEHYNQINPSSPLYKQLFTSANLNAAIVAKDYDLASIILRRHPGYKQEISGELVKLAIRQGDIEQVRYIIEANSELLEYDNESTPFIVACNFENLQIIDYLLDRGANIHAAQSLAEPNSCFIREMVNNLVGFNSRIDAIQLRLDNYLQRLETNLQTPNYNQRFTVHHIVKAIEARDLPVVELLLRYCPHLEAQLSQIDMHRINQQRHQKIIQTRFSQLLEQLNTHANILNETGCLDKYQAAVSLSETLHQAGTNFFSSNLSEESKNRFEHECINALNLAKIPLGGLHGWGGFPLFVRAILGLLSTITIVPALIVHAVSSSGYVGTFFKPYKTDSALCLEHLSNEINVLQEQLRHVY